MIKLSMIIFNCIRSKKRNELTTGRPGKLILVVHSITTSSVNVGAVYEFPKSFHVQNLKTVKTSLSQ